MKATTLAKVESHLRPMFTKLPPGFVVSKASQLRLDFLERLHKEIPDTPYITQESQRRTLWGIKFRSPIMNAAGMFKNGECYEMTAKQGAAAYLGGTSTWNPRRGNKEEGVYLPFVPYPRTGAASNFLGLPNNGDEENSRKVQELERIYHTPIGWSVMGSPDFKGEEKLENLVRGMKLYDNAGVDFLEINESCPNTSHTRPQEDDLTNRLRYIKEQFIDTRTRNLPVVVKFSTDTKGEQIPELLDILFEYGYSGVNFGNTSTDYEKRKETVDPKEHKLYDFFTSTFGGGISGRPLKEDSLTLASRSVEYVKAGSPTQEFHVIRTGGIESIEDINDSESAGISLNQWFTGYFENFAKHGHNLYWNLFET